MAEPPNPAVKALAGIEVALREAVARAAKPTMPLALALRFFQAAIRLSRCMRQCRKVAGLPRAWPADLAALLDDLVVAANGRLTDPAVTDDRALRLALVSEGLSRALVLALPVPEQPQKTTKKPAPNVAAPQPAASPVLPAMPRRRPNEYEGVGAIAVRVSNLPATPQAIMADAIRQAMRRPAAA